MGVVRWGGHGLGCTELLYDSPALHGIQSFYSMCDSKAMQWKPLTFPLTPPPLINPSPSPPP
eukprot:c11660_g1_i1 orf=2-184(-)